jgi:FkbM family methyltransferase
MPRWIHNTMPAGRASATGARLSDATGARLSETPPIIRHAAASSRAEARCNQPAGLQRAYALEPLARWRAVRIYEDEAGLSGPPLIVDLGAQIGAASVWFALRHPGARVIALERDPGSFPLLQANAAAHSQITALQAAIAPRPGQAALVDSRTRSGGMRASSERAVGAEEVAGEADAITIDQLLEGAGAGAEPFILKVDIAGAEDELFSTHWQSLARFALVIVELHDRLLPGAGASRSFLRWHVAHGRDLVPIGENLFSLIPG